MTYFTFQNLYHAYTDCRKRKSAKFYHLKFAENLEEKLLDLERQLQNRTYKPGRSIAFVIQKPKTREIFAADFADRVVHHLLFNYLSPIFERTFIYDSWACRKGKGTHRAMLRLKKFANQIEKEGRRNGVSCPYYLKMDIKSFFASIDQRILYDLIQRKVKNEEILWLAKVIIFHDCAHDIAPKIQSRPSLFDKLPPEKSLFTAERGKGLPIGNLTSQFFANVYLDELDRFVKHELKAKYYLRYVDDFLILDESEEKLEEYRVKIIEFVADKLALKVHPDKHFIKPVGSGIDFVGYFVRSDYVLIRKRVAGEWQWRMSGIANLEKKEQLFYSYMAHAKWANAYWLGQKMQGELIG